MDLQASTSGKCFLQGTALVRSYLVHYAFAYVTSNYLFERRLNRIECIGTVCLDYVVDDELSGDYSVNDL